MYRPLARVTFIFLLLILGSAAVRAELVISQVYGGGGNSGAPLTNDYVEIFNRGSETLPLGGLSLQYASATGSGNLGANAGQLVVLPQVDLLPGGYFLVQLAGGSNGVPLPLADATGTINMAGASGKIALVTGSDTLGCNGGSTPCDTDQLARIVDLVGYGSANFFEGSGAAPTLSNTRAAFRIDDGRIDTDDNVADFVTGAPAPRNCATVPGTCSTGTEPEDPPEPEDPVDPPSTATPYRIHEIQGNGLGSPLLGTEVVTEGVVTAVRTNGYFIQSTVGEEDADPATSEGLFMFTGNNNVPADAVVGNRVRVIGTVGQFVRAPHGYPQTQLVGSTLELVSSGEPLPAPVVLGADDLSPEGFVGRLGRYQSMRATLPTGRVTGPTNRFGDFYVTLPEVPRPAREPGVSILEEVPLPPELAIPRFDRNPERLRVESTGLVGGAPLFVDAGVLVGNLEGIMYFDRGDFTLLIGDSADVTLSGSGPMPAPIGAAPENALSIASFNIENLSGGDNVPATRLDKLTQVFCQFLDLPDVVGLIEIANLATLQRLAGAINDNEFGHCPESPAYEAYLLAESGSQRLGYLVSTRETASGWPRVQVIDVVDEAANEPLVAPDGSTDSGPLFDRPPLRLEAVLHGDNGVGQPFGALLTHNLSLLAVNDLRVRSDAWETRGNRARGKRLAQAVRLAELADVQQTLRPDEPLFVIGDFNAFEFSDGYADVLGIVSGNPAPANEVLLYADSPLSTPLHNLTLTLDPSVRHSYVFQGNTQSLDHVLVNDAAFDVGEVSLHVVRINSDYAADGAQIVGTPTGTSDHDPIVARLLVPALVDADLAVALAAQNRPLLAGSIAKLPIEVRNFGPGSALLPRVELTLDAAADQILGVTAAGWQCETLAAGTRSTLSCARSAALEAGAIETLTLELEVIRSDPKASLTLQAVVSTASNDPVFANDAASVTYKLAGKPASAGPKDKDKVQAKAREKVQSLLRNLFNGWNAFLARFRG